MGWRLFWSQSLSAPRLGMLKGSRSQALLRGAPGMLPGMLLVPLVGPRNSHHTHTFALKESDLRLPRTCRQPSRLSGTQPLGKPSSQN